MRRAKAHCCHKANRLDTAVKDESKANGSKRPLLIDLTDVVTNWPTSYKNSAIFILAVVSFARSYAGDFVFDDSEAILNNRDVVGQNKLAQMFDNDFWGSPIRSNESHKSYRPLTVLSFRLNYILFGLNPISYHIVNILLHGVVAVLVHSLCQKLFRDNKDKSDTSANSSVVGFLASVLFALHPIHTEAVASIVGRAELLSAVFFLWAFHLHLDLSDGNCSLMKEVAFVALCILSVLSKEQGITVLILCAGYEIYKHKENICDLHRTVGQMIGDHRNNNMQKLSVYTAPLNALAHNLSRLLYLCLTMGILVWFRLSVMDFEGPKFSYVDNPASFQPNWWIRVLNYNYIYSLNLLLLIFPIWLCFDWSMNCLSLIKSLCDPRLTSVVGFWLLALLLVTRIVYDQNPQRKKILYFGGLTLVIPFLPAANIFVRVGFVIAERVLYLPSIGFCILLAQLFYSLHQSAKTARMQGHLGFGFTLICLLYLSKSIGRSGDWLTEKNLFMSGAQVCPNNAKVHYNLAKILSDSGLKKEAVAKYRQAIELNPTYEQAMNNLANLLKEQSQMSEAETLLRQAIKLKPDFAAAWMNLGIVLGAQRRFADSELSYLTALKLRRNYADCLFNLGNLYLDQGRLEEAKSSWINTTNIQPYHSRAWINLIILADNMGEFHSAKQFGHEAFKYVRNEPNLHFAMANAFGKSNEFVKAEWHYKIAIEMDRSQANYYGNLGVLYHRWKRYIEAENFYKKALQLNPTLPQVVDNLRLLRS